MNKQKKNSILFEQNRLGISMRALRDLVVGIIDTFVDVFKDKLVFINLFLQNLFEFGTFCQIIKPMLYNSLARTTFSIMA